MKREHHGGWLQDPGAGLAAFKGASRQIGGIAIAGAVDEKVGGDFDLVALAIQRDCPQTALAHIGAYCLGMQEHLHAGFAAKLGGKQLKAFGVDIGH